MQTTPIPNVKKGEISEKTTIFEMEKISADKGSNVVLECKPEDEKVNQNFVFCEHSNIYNLLQFKAVWLVKPDFELIITTASDGTTSLSIFNVMHDRTYECRRSDNIVRRFVLTINGKTSLALSLISVRLIKPLEDLHCKIHSQFNKSKAGRQNIGNYVETHMKIVYPCYPRKTIGSVCEYYLRNNSLTLGSHAVSRITWVEYN